MNTKRMLVYGFLTWLIPFLASIVFYDKSGQLLVEIHLFKSIMIVVGTAVGMWLMVKYFMGVKKDYWKTGLVVGLVWLLMNWGLDLVTLVMLMKMDVVTYFTQIGLRYLSLPLMVFGAAYLLEKRK